MKITFLRSYRSQNGNPVFVYKVTGSKADLERYKELQGANYREDEETGAALYFTTRSCGAQGKLVITTNDNIVVDTSKFDQAASLVSQYGGNLGDALAQQAAADLLGGAPAESSSESASAPVAEEAPAEAEEGLDEA